ncbi:MAG: NUDIX hydrolase [Parvularculaceae bacterium]
MSSKDEKIGPWTVHARNVVYDNPWVRVTDCEVTRPDGAPGQYGVIGFKHLAVGVLPIFEDGTVILVGQHRFPHDAYSWELPEGGGAKGEPPLRTAKRELCEETGYSAEFWHHYFSFDLSNSVTDEKAVCFLAWDLRPGEAEPDGDEVLDYRTVKFSELHEMVLKGEISDSLTIVLVLTARAMAEKGLLPEKPAKLLLSGG